MFDLVHDLEVMLHRLLQLAASGNILINMSDAREFGNCSFTNILHFHGHHSYLTRKEKIPDVVSSLAQAMLSFHIVHSVRYSNNNH